MNRFKLTAALLASCLVVSAWAKADDTKAKSASEDSAKSGQKYFDSLDKNKDGSLTRDELPAGWREQFGNLDTSKDDKLSLEELRPHLARLVLVPVPVEVVSMYMIESPHCNPSLEQLQETYEMLRKADTNNDGKIAKEEAQAARDQAIEKRIDTIFKRCDANNNSKISRDECQGSLTTALFDKADKNKDGYVTNDELKACCLSDAEHDAKSAKSNSGDK
jgi:Ca2+-binding EF-hand superfamily protein